MARGQRNGVRLEQGDHASAPALSAAGVVSTNRHLVGTRDFDDNGHDDILWQNDKGAVSIGDNGNISSWHIAGTGDFDGNGHDDIHWQNHNGMISIWMGGSRLVANPSTVPRTSHVTASATSITMAMPMFFGAVTMVRCRSGTMANRALRIR